MTEPSTAPPAHNPAIAELLANLQAVPDLASTTPGPECPNCHTRFVITYGSRSKRWLVLHSGLNRECPRYSAKLPSAETQEEALAIAQEAGK